MHALHEVMAAGGYEVTALLSTYNTDSNRVFMHGVRIELLREQTRSLGLPLIDIGLGKDHTSADYESAMRAALMREKASGVSAVIFGDIFLEDLRQYRVDRLETVGMNAVFPLWKRDTKELARRFISLGYKAVVTCADGNELGEEYVGREYDLEFIQSLPAAVDPGRGCLAGTGLAPRRAANRPGRPAAGLACFWRKRPAALQLV